MKESTIVANFFEDIKKLRAAGERIKFIKIHGGQWTSGQPDVMGCYEGHMYVIEFKNETGRATKRQEVQLDEWSNTGATSMIMRDGRAAVLAINPEWESFFPTRRKSGAAGRTQVIPESFDLEGG